MSGRSTRKRKFAILLGAPVLLLFALFLVFRSPYRGPTWTRGAEVRAPASSVSMWFLAKGMNRLTVGILMGEPVTLNGEPRHRPLFGELRGNGDAWAYNWEDTCNYFYVAFDAHGGIYGYGWK